MAIEKEPAKVVAAISGTDWFRNLPMATQSLIRLNPFDVPFRLGEQEETVLLVGVERVHSDDCVECWVRIDPLGNQQHPQAQTLGGFSDKAFLDELEPAAPPKVRSA